MIRISENKIDPEQALRAFRENLSNAGAIASFTGVVRDDGKTESLTLSHYPGFTEKQIEAFAGEAKHRWGFQDSLIMHRVGRMDIGEPIVLVAVAAEHRRAAFEACDFLMDKLKCEAPFWKQETVGGQAKWIEPRAEDKVDLGRWS